LDKKTFAIFDQIHAEDELKQKTTQYLCAEIKKQQNTLDKSSFSGRSSILRKWRFAITCIFLAVFLLCGGTFNKIYFTPAAYIDIDVNPSIALTVNPYGKVIRIGAYNADGLDILNRINVAHTDYREALEKLLAIMDADGYLGQDPLLYVTVQADESQREHEMLNDLQQTVYNTNEAHQYHIVADIYAVTAEVKHCADEYQVSPAKYLTIQDLLAVDADTDFDECRGHSIHELQLMIEDRCRQHEEENSGDSGSSPSGHHEEHGHHGGHH